MASTGGMAANGDMTTPAGQLLERDFMESQQAAIKAGYLTPEQAQLMNDNMAVRKQGAYVGYMTKNVINDMRAKGAPAEQIYAKAFELMSFHADRLQLSENKFSTEQMAQLKEHMKAQVSLTLVDVQQQDILAKGAEEKTAQSELLKLNIALSDANASGNVAEIASVTAKLRAATEHYGKAGAAFVGSLNQGRALIKAYENDQAKMVDDKNKEAAKGVTAIVNELTSGRVSAESRAILDGASDSDSELNIEEGKDPVTIDVDERMPLTPAQQIAKRLGMGKEQAERFVAAVAQGGISAKDTAALVKLIDKLPPGPHRDAAEDNMRNSLSAQTNAVYNAMMKNVEKDNEALAKTQDFQAFLNGNKLVPVDKAVEGFEEALKRGTLGVSPKDPSHAARITEMMRMFNKSTPSIDAVFNNISADSVRLARAYRDAAPEGIGGQIPAWQHIPQSEVYQAILQEYDMLGSSIAEQQAAAPDANEDTKRRGREAEDKRTHEAIVAVRKRDAFSKTPAGQQQAMALDDPAYIAATADVRGYFGRALQAFGNMLGTPSLTPWGGVETIAGAVDTVKGNDIDLGHLPPNLIADYKNGWIRAQQLNPSGKKSDWQESARTFIVKQGWGLTEYPATGKQRLVKHPIEKSTTLLAPELREQISAFVGSVLNARGRTGWQYEPQIIDDLNHDELRRKIVDKGEFEARWVGFGRDKDGREISGYEISLRMGNGPALPIGDPLKPAVFYAIDKDSLGDSIRKSAAAVQKATNIAGDSPSGMARGISNIASTVAAKTVNAVGRTVAEAANDSWIFGNLVDDKGAGAIEAQRKAGLSYWLQRNKP
jgi:hypothetical protein